MPRPKHYLFLLPLALTLFLVTSELVERSMYTDGVAYAGISDNLANGVGSLWNPRLSDVHNTAFFGHPPLVFGLQSLVFRVFGSSLVSERVYAGTIFLLSALLLVLLWREVLRDYPPGRKLWFLPLTLWLANEVVYHFYPANVLEPTTGLFTLLAVYAGVRTLRPGTAIGRQLVGAVLLGFFVFLGTLCKGFVALFPLALYGLYFLVHGQPKLRKAALLTGVACLALGLGYLLLWQYAPARSLLQRYFEGQVLASVSGELTAHHFRDNRFYIIRRTVEVLLPAVGITLLLVGVGWRRLKGAPGTGPQLRAAWLLLGLGAAASLPLAISPKQSFYYLLPSMAYFAAGLACLCVPVVASYFERATRPWERWGIPVLMVGLLMAGAYNTARHWGAITRRDRVVLSDIDAMATVVPVRATVGSVGDIGELVSYFYRHHYVSIDTAVGAVPDYEFVIINEVAEVPAGFELLELGTERYRLARRE